MIARPSSRQLLETVRAELRSTVRDALTDTDVRARLDMLDSILGSVIARADDEAAWLREEIAAIERVAELVLAQRADDGAVAEALATLRANRAPSLRLPDLHGEYALAGETFSRCLEAAMRTGGALRTEVEQVLQDRLRREVRIRGEFSLAGRL